MIAQRVKARSLECRCNISVNNLAVKTVNDPAVGRCPKGALEIFSRTIPFNMGSCERTFTSPSVPKPLFLQRRCQSLKTKQPAGYISFAYSALASFRMGMSGSASFQRAKKCGFRFGGIAGHGVASGKDRGGTNICLLNAAETETHVK
jgi:hypothetical protein